MSPIHLRYTNEVSETLSKNEISKINSWKTTSAFRAFRFSTAPFRQAVVVLLVSFGVCSLLDTHRVSAAVVVDASSAKSASPGNIAWHSCEGNPADVDCAQVQVPLDWNQSNGPEITLAVARHRASQPNERIGSMFVNFGGPGVAGVPAVLTDGANLDKLGGGRFDVVGWDPRGTGDSTLSDVLKTKRVWSNSGVRIGPSRRRQQASCAMCRRRSPTWHDAPPRPAPPCSSTPPLRTQFAILIICANWSVTTE